MLKEITAYFNALDKVAKKGSTEADIEALLNGMHDAVKYEHIEYQADFDKTTWRNAFKRNLNRGAYDNGPRNQIRILNVIYGKSHVAVEYSHGMIQEDKSWQADMKMFALFGFTGGKISLVREYW